MSILRQRGSHTVIDKITVNLNIKKDCYEAEFSNLGLKGIPIGEEYPIKYDRLLCGGKLIPEGMRNPGQVYTVSQKLGYGVVIDN